MADRKLKNAPIVEHIFEMRWGHPRGRDALWDEFEASRGVLHKALRKRFPHRIRLQEIPSAMWLHMGVSGVVIDRFTREQQLASYPLAQYGPGVASYNVDGKSYQWRTLLPELQEFFRDVCSAHEEPLLKDRLESISVRAVDFYRLDQEQINDFLSSRLQVRVASPLDSMPQLVGAKVVPTYRSSWSIDVHSKFEFSAEMGQANGKLGLVVQFHYESKGSHVESTGFETWLAHAHAVTGDAFFKMLSPKLKEELNGTSLY